MELREATPGDFAAIVRLVPNEEELFLVYPKGRHPFSIDQLRALADSRKELTVVVDEGAVAGFANLYNIEPGRYAFIGNVVIARPSRRRGFGRALVAHMMRTACEKYGVPEVRISVFNRNTPALLLYAALGFQPYSVEERTAPSGKRVALIHMAVEAAHTPSHG